MSSLEVRAHLIFDEFRGARMDATHTSSVLRGECCDDTGSITV